MSPLPYMRGFLAVQSVPIAIYEGLFGGAKCPLAIYEGLFGNAHCSHRQKIGAFWQCKVSPSRYMRGFLPVQSVPIAISAAVAMSLHDRAHVLRRAPEDLQPHLPAGTLVQGKPLKTCGPLVALGGRPCIGLCARPYFAARGAMKAQLERLSLHCVAR